METHYWLADGKDTDRYGTIWKVDLIDGPHSDPQGVKDAEAIIKGIGLDRGLNRNYVMVMVAPVPDLKPDINTNAVQSCKTMMDAANKKHK